MAAENGSTIDGVVKRQYADRVEKLLPEDFHCIKRIKFKQRKKLGEQFQVPVRVRHAHGHTIDSGTTMDAFTLNASRPGKTVPALVTAMPYVLRDQISTTLLSRSETNEQAIEDALSIVLPDMLVSASWYHEMCWLYGGKDLGSIASLTGSGTDRVWTMTTATFAPGLWINAEGLEVDCYAPATPLATLRNSNAAIVLGAVDVTARTLTVTGNAADLTACAALDVLVPRGANLVWFSGIDAMATNTSTLFNISAATYPSTWKASSVAAGSAALTFAKMVSGAAKSVVKSGTSKLSVMVPTYTWVDLMVAESTLRRYAGDNGQEFTNGANSIKFYGPNGELEIIPHSMVKEGEAFMVDFSTFERPGSSDLTFERPGGQKGKFQHDLEGVMATEFQIWSDQSAFCYRPNRIVKFTGITNTAGA